PAPRSVDPAQKRYDLQSEREVDLPSTERPRRKQAEDAARPQGLNQVPRNAAQRLEFRRTHADGGRHLLDTCDHVHNCSHRRIGAKRGHRIRGRPRVMNRVLHRSVISVDAEITLEGDYCRMASAPMDLVTSAMRLPQIAILLVRFVILLFRQERNGPL